MRSRYPIGKITKFEIEQKEQEELNRQSLPRCLLLFHLKECKVEGRKGVEHERACVAWESVPYYLLCSKPLHKFSSIFIFVEAVQLKRKYIKATNIIYNH